MIESIYINGVERNLKILGETIITNSGILWLTIKLFIINVALWASGQTIECSFYNARYDS